MWLSLPPHTWVSWCQAAPRHCPGCVQLPRPASQPNAEDLRHLLTYCSFIQHCDASVGFTPPSALDSWSLLVIHHIWVLWGGGGSCTLSKSKDSSWLCVLLLLKYLIPQKQIQYSRTKPGTGGLMTEPGRHSMFRWFRQIIKIFFTSEQPYGCIEFWSSQVEQDFNFENITINK